MIKKPNVKPIVYPFWSFLVYSYDWISGERKELHKIDTVEKAREDVRVLNESNKTNNETKVYYFIKIDVNRELEGYHKVSGGWKVDSNS